MKTIVTAIALLVLSGCGSFTSLAELEAEALRTGDWSAVELRERQIARRNLQSTLQCPPGEIGYCVKDFGDMRCTCVDQGRLNAFLRN